jgi:pSer/pThr/pTyr-binding forkhead associated (FHA) protein
MGVLRYTIRRGSETIASRSFAGSTIKIGRSGDIRLEDPGVSRTHALVEFTGDLVTIVDLSSASGTFLNGRRVERAPVKQGDVIGVGGTSIEIDGIDTEPTPASARSDTARSGGSAPRYCSIKLLDKCPHCGSGLPVNGLLGTVLCGNCQKETNLGARYWKAVLEDPDNDYSVGGGSYSLNFETDVRWKAERPACVKCAAELSVDDVPVGRTDDVLCPSCGQANSTYPAPDWLREALPSVRQVYCGERPAGAPGSTGLEVEDGSKPVILSCPQCKGSLKVTSRSDRLVPCEYCGADVYLPDDLWKRLHPVKTSSTWYIRYEGKSQARIEKERELARDQERRSRDEEAFQEQERKRRKLKPSHIGWTIFAAVIATVVLGPLLPLLSGGGDPLFGIAGKLLCPGACEGCEGLRTETWTTQTSDGTSTQFDFYCAPPGAPEEQWVRVSDGTMFVTTVAVLFPVLLVLSAVVLIFIRLSQR